MYLFEELMVKSRLHPKNYSQKVTRFSFLLFKGKRLCETRLFRRFVFIVGTVKGRGPVEAAKFGKRERERR